MADEVSYPPCFYRRDNHLMLFFKKRGDHLFGRPLAEPLFVGRQLFCDDRSADIDERFEHRVLMAAVLCLHMIDAAIIWNVSIKAGDHRRRK